MNIETIKEYCTGCGLCHSVNETKLEKSSNGFLAPVIRGENDKQFCDMVCPANGKHLVKQDNSTWGHYLGVYSGYSTDKEIRFKSASGGIISSISVFLLESGLVDGVIQVGADTSDPYKTKNYVSTTKDDVISRCGSRYIESHTLQNLADALSSGGKYALVGRPCDIVVLKNFLEQYPEYKENIYCTLAFFCAGTPSVKASKKLVKYLGVNSDEVDGIRYRGYGWPGKTTVFSGSTTKYMDYINAWTDILGRDIRKICKFCSDGVGEFADISCGDLWYLIDGEPSFNESDGMNVIFSRSKKGEDILNCALREEYISIENYQLKINDLLLIQPNHAKRKKILYPRIIGMKLVGKKVPNYDLHKLKQYCKDEPKVEVLHTILGTMKRALKGRI